MLNCTFSSLNQNKFFEGLEYEIAVALEDFNSIELDKAYAVETHLNHIKQVGMSRNTYYALEELAPGILSGINPKRLTENPSRTYADVALEAASNSSFFSKFSNAGGVANFFIAFFDWLVGKLTGHGSLGLAGRLQEAWLKGRKRADKLHEYEAGITDMVIKYKSDLVFSSLINDVAKSIASNDDRNAAEIAAAMIEACSKSQGQSVVPTIALARICIANNCNVADFRTVSQRMMRFSLIKSNPAQTCGLAATRQGLPASILIGQEVDVDSRMAGDLQDLAKQYIKMSQALARMPMGEDGVPAWIKECEKQADTFDTKVKSSRIIHDLVNRWNTDAAFMERLSAMQVGTIGFWYDVESPIQGDNVFDPEPNAVLVRRVFEMNRETSMDVFAASVESTIGTLQDAVNKIKSVDQQRMEKLVGNYNSNSAALRSIIKSFRSDATTILRIVRVLESYVNGYVRAFKTVKPFRAAYEQAATRLTHTSIK